MRKMFVYWFLGLAAVSTAAGCGIFRDSRGCGCAANGCADGKCASVKSTPTTPAPAKGQRVERPVRTDSTPSSPGATNEPIQRLPDVTPKEKRGNLPALNKNDIHDEDAIVNRELAAGSKNGLREVAAEAPTKLVVEAVPTNSEFVAPEVKDTGVEKEKTIELKSTDIHYGQEGNFKTVTGQVQQFRKAWRLRYADVGQEDVYGGSVVLEGSDLEQLRDGKHIRVTGVLVPPATRTSAPTYRVKSIEILD